MVEDLDRLYRMNPLEFMRQEQAKIDTVNEDPDEDLFPEEPPAVVPPPVIQAEDCDDESLFASSEDSAADNVVLKPTKIEEASDSSSDLCEPNYEPLKE